MGRLSFRKGKGGFGKRGQTNQRNWKSTETENKIWEQYYKDLKIIPEAEFPAFKKACQSVLPLTFRFTGSKSHAIEVRENLIKEYIPHLTGIEWEGEAIDPPQAIPFYPDNLAWKASVSKSVIRKNPEFARLQRFLVVETDVGNISRQEAVSMIPPLLLDVEPHHLVIDLCAAPGSKTAQLIEALHVDASKPPTGVVIANDSDYRRSHMLIHQTKRLNSPNLIVTNHDAQLFPRVRANEEGTEYIKFDRVLCDVPCSGDGTMRKNIQVWSKWSPGDALGLHPTQINILMRGIKMLKPGGRLVYSTCSLNPIENEAVVAEALRLSKGSVKLINCDDRLPGLERVPGITHWPVMGKDKQYKEIGAEGLLKSTFPPTKEEIEEFRLENCIRVYPHLQDTGGFFISVFEKNEIPPKVNINEKVNVNDVKVTTENNKRELTSISDSEETSSKKPKLETSKPQTIKKIKLPRDANEEPFKFLSSDNEVLKNIWDFYGISQELKRDNFLVRNATGEPIRTIYYSSSVVKNILKFNEGKLKFVHAAIKAFTSQKNEGSCNWRVQSESVSLIYPFVSNERKLIGSLPLLLQLCQITFPKFDDLKGIDNDFSKNIENVPQGCAFLKIPRDGKLDDLVLPLWKGKSSVNMMLPKKDTEELLHRIFKIENVKEIKQKQAPSEITNDNKIEEKVEEKSEVKTEAKIEEKPELNIEEKAEVITTEST